VGIQTQIADNRRRAGKSQADVAGEVGIGRTHFSQIERGEVLPSVLLARRIAEALDCTIDDLWPQNAGEASDEGKNVGRSPDGDAPDVQLVREP
jgi:DNA-binding XRE family transcriptional regulator